MRLRTKLLGLTGALLISGAALAQYVPGAYVITSLVGSFSVPVNTTGPQSAVLPLNGGTFTCATSAATIADPNVNAGSLILLTLKTVGGTVAASFIHTVTPGTGFTVTCGASDTSTYSYIILG
jgi:hypothetical protein